MLKTSRLFLALCAFAALAACSGSGCGNCTVPSFKLAPGSTPPPPGVIQTPVPTPSPTPAPPPGVLSCNQAPAAFALGPALAPFALLAGSTLTNVGNTFVSYAPGAVTGATNDDLIGVWSAGGARAVVGFPPGLDADGVNAIYAASHNNSGAATAAAMAAQLALTGDLVTLAGTAQTAPNYPDGTDLSTSSSAAGNVCGAAGASVCPLGTFPAGVYKSVGSFAIGTGNLTLDGGGNPQGVFIFDSVSTLTTVLNGVASGNINLVNGAGACNIYWGVGSSATLGGATFYGNVLASASVTVNATTLGGRALANVGAVSIPVAGGSFIVNPGGK